MKFLLTCTIISVLLTACSSSKKNAKVITRQLKLIEVSSTSWKPGIPGNGGKEFYITVNAKSKFIQVDSLWIDSTQIPVYVLPKSRAITSNSEKTTFLPVKENSKIRASKSSRIKNTITCPISNYKGQAVLLISNNNKREYLLIDSIKTVKTDLKP